MPNDDDVIWTFEHTLYMTGAVIVLAGLLGAPFKILLYCALVYPTCDLLARAIRS